MTNGAMRHIKVRSILEIGVARLERFVLGRFLINSRVQRQVREPVFKRKRCGGRRYRRVAVAAIEVKRRGKNQQTDNYAEKKSHSLWNVLLENRIVMELGMHSTRSLFDYRRTKQ